MSLSKKDLINKIAEKLDLKKTEVDAVISATFDTIVEESKSDDIRIAGFGTFKSVARPERTARNPKTGESIKIAAKKAVRFVPGKAYKESVNG